MKFSLLIANTNRSLEYLKTICKINILPDEIIIYSDQINNRVSNFLNKKKISYTLIKSNNVNCKLIEKKLLNSKNKNFIFSGYSGKIIKKKIISKKNFVHCHPGLLPYYRGSTTIYYSLLINKNVYCTIFKMSEKIDNGKILFIKKFKKPKKLETINHSYDDKIRALTLADYLINTDKKFKNISRKSNICDKYYIAHPIIRLMVINKKSLKFVKLISY